LFTGGQAMFAEICRQVGDPAQTLNCNSPAISFIPQACSSIDGRKQQQEKVIMIVWLAGRELGTVMFTKLVE
jgi:hypothetical protein